MLNRMKHGMLEASRPLEPLVFNGTTHLEDERLVSADEWSL